ncbi:hypothetical protein NXW58_04430 [Bacteroides faecis]|nr:hypothetical protein NXW58_04430 [Bacteroides faecis]
MYEKINVPVEGTLIEYLPSISVVVPVVVPLTTTLTPRQRITGHVCDDSPNHVLGIAICGIRKKHRQ